MNTHKLAKQLKYSVLFALALSTLSGCAQLDEWSKPNVNGLRQDPSFDVNAIEKGGISNITITSSLNSNEITPSAIAPQLTAAIREKRSDITVNTNGQYKINADVLTNDIRNSTNSSDQLYKVTTRSIKVNYTITDKKSNHAVWTGIIETSQDTSASYKLKKDDGKNEKTSDKILNALVDSMVEPADQPFPSPPNLSDVMQSNFEGFALNLPQAK
ncbi:hypothetical protein [Photobacterium profundum]|uniref:hypothetical protein n=1 Tax=Photobacterium profundum TaxID=74109 RepID=UPI003D095DBE